MGKTTFVRDKLGRVTKKVTPGGTVYYGWDASGKKTSLKDADLRESVYVWGNTGRLEKLELDKARTTYYEYDRSGRLTRRVFPGGPGAGVIQAYYSYDVAGRLSVLANRDSDLDILINYFAYERDAVGFKTRVEHKDNAFTYYHYDALDRLTREFRINPVTTVYDQEYVFDAASNRTKLVDRVANQTTYYTYNSMNLLTKAWNKDAPSTTYFEHDDAQRMTAAKITGGQSTYYSYDQKDQITGLTFEKPGGADDVPREIQYTGIGERTRLKVGTGSFTEAYMTYDGRKLLREVDDGGNVLKRYRYNAITLGDHFGEVSNAPLGEFVEVEDGGVRANPATDGCGSTDELHEDGGGGGESEVLISTWNDYGVSVVQQSGTLMPDQRNGFVPGQLLTVNTTEDTFLEKGALYRPAEGIYTVGDGAIHVSIGDLPDLGPAGGATGEDGKGQSPDQQWWIIEIQDEPPTVRDGPRGGDPPVAPGCDVGDPQVYKVQGFPIAGLDLMPIVRNPNFGEAYDQLIPQNRVGYPRVTGLSITKNRTTCKWQFFVVIPFTEPIGSKCIFRMTESGRREEVNWKKGKWDVIQRPKGSYQEDGTAVWRSKYVSDDYEQAFLYTDGPSIPTPPNRARRLSLTQQISVVDKAKPGVPLALVTLSMKFFYSRIPMRILGHLNRRFCGPFGQGFKFDTSLKTKFAGSDPNKLGPPGN